MPGLSEHVLRSSIIPGDPVLFIPVKGSISSETYPTAAKIFVARGGPLWEGGPGYSVLAWYW